MRAVAARECTSILKNGARTTLQTRICARPLHTKSITAEVSTQLKLPKFSASSSNISLLKTPSDFLSTLKDLISSATERLYLSSLYIGKDSHDLVDCIRWSLLRNPSLKVTILTDALRSTREGPWTGENPSCASLLASLSRDFPNQVDIRLYRTPGLSRTMESLIGKRLVEGVGLQHMKIYGNERDVMLSGANLSSDYFTNRQDRYVLIKEHQMMSRYFHSLILATAGFSYSLQAGENYKRHHAPFELKWGEGNKLLLAENYDGAVCEDGVVAQEQQDHKEYHFQKTASSVMRAFTQRWAQLSLDNASSSHDTSIVPLLQMGPLQITQETDAMPLLFSTFAPGSKVNFTSGYFSLFPAYKQLILSLPEDVKTQIIAAAPISNGFYGSKGVSKFIPPAYTWLERKFYEEIQRCGKEGDVAIEEWVREGWTYHAKGLWYTPPGHTSPTHTLIGSSNFGSRSALRDLECTLLMETQSDSPLSTDLRHEIDALNAHATIPVNDDLFNQPDRRVSLPIRIATEIIKGRL